MRSVFNIEFSLEHSTIARLVIASIVFAFDVLFLKDINLIKGPFVKRMDIRLMTFTFCLR